MPESNAPSPEVDESTRELIALADDTAREASIFLTSVTEVASGANPDAAIPLLLLALSQVSAAGARLGAIQDVVPSDRYEPDTGPDGDAEPLRDNLANLFGELDEYHCVADPITGGEPDTGSIASDVADIALALEHGLQHYRQGKTTEALWWWQFSYLSTWGDQALLSLRAVASILSHVRLDVDEDVVAEAEFDALHP